MAAKYIINPLSRKLTQLARQVKEGNPEAACELATLGSNAAVSALIHALAHPSWDVRSNILSGIRTAFDGKEAQVELSELLMDAVAETLRHHFRRQTRDQPQQSDFASQRAVEILPLLNRDRAIMHLTHPDVLRLDNPDLSLILRALNNLGHPLEMNLVPWLEKIRPQVLADSHADSCIYSEILCNLAFLHHPSLPQWIKEVEQDFPYYGDAQIGAAKAHCYFLGLPANFHWKVLDLSYPKEVRVQMPKSVQQFVRAIEMVTWSNAGFEQYMQHEGNEVASDIECLTAMGAQVQVWRLRKCVELFGPAGVPDTFEERVARIDEDNEYIWNAIMDLGFPDGIESPDLQALYFRFAAKHVEEFRRHLGEHA